MATKKPAGATGEEPQSGTSSAAGETVETLKAAVDTLMKAVEGLTGVCEDQAKTIARMDHDLRNYAQAVNFGGAAGDDVSSRLARLERHAGL